jgi:hypothetical protein
MILRSFKLAFANRRTLLPGARRHHGRHFDELPRFQLSTIHSAIGLSILGRVVAQKSLKVSFWSHDRRHCKGDSI